jgi:hypothetical protein
MSKQVLTVANGIVQSDDANVISSFVERDSSGDSTFRNVIAEGYLKGAGVKLGTVSKTANYTATTSDFIILVDATSGAVTILLPAAASSTNTVLCVKKTDASGNAVTVDGNASETIDGATTVALAARYDTCYIICNGTSWHIIALSV